MLMLRGKMWRKMGCLEHMHSYLCLQSEVASYLLILDPVGSLTDTGQSLQRHKSTSRDTLDQARSMVQENICGCETYDKEEQVARRDSLSLSGYLHLQA